MPLCALLPDLGLPLLSTCAAPYNTRIRLQTSVLPTCVEVPGNVGALGKELAVATCSTTAPAQQFVLQDQSECVHMVGWPRCRCGGVGRRGRLWGTLVFQA